MANACIQSRKSIYSRHFMHYNYGEALVHCFYTLLLRDHAIVKLLLYLKKHALQDDMKVLGV